MNAQVNGQINGHADDTVKVFISHEHHDKDMAAEVKKILSDLSPRLKIFVSEKDINPGDEWGEEIKIVLSQSNILMLLFTDPGNDWDWCLYEAGLFNGMQTEIPRRVIVLFTPGNTPPKQLKHLQAVEASEPQLGEFFDKFIRDTKITGIKPALHAEMSLEAIEAAAKRLAALFVPTEYKSEYPARRFEIQVPFGAEPVRDALFAEATVTGTDRTWEIFGKGGGTWEWSELERKAGEMGSTRWLRELEESLVLVARGDLAKPITGWFKDSAQGNTIYRPVLYKVRLRNGIATTFHVLLNQENPPLPVAGPGAVGALFNLLRVMHRYRWIVMEPALDKLVGAADEEERSSDLQLLKEQTIELEAQIKLQKMMDRERIINAFAAASQEAVKSLLDQWRDEFRGPFLEALQQQDVRRILEVLRVGKSRNREIIQCTAARYAELLSE